MTNQETNTESADFRTIRSVAEEPKKYAFILFGCIVLLFFVIYSDIFLLKKIFTHDTLVWYGSFHYYIESLGRGEFPYWDPYLICGTPFYPNIPLHGLLDPLVLLCAAAVKFLGVETLTAYIYFRLARLLLFAGGAFLLYRAISGHLIGSLLSAGVLLFALPHSYFPQFGTIDTVYLTPYAMCLLLYFLQNPAGPKRALFIAAFTLVSGLSMVVYVPSFYVFNLIVFLTGIVIFRIVPVRPVVSALREPRLAVFAGTCLLITAMMAAPPLMTMLKDTSGNGELFPMQRIIQKNDRIFKQIVASDIDTGSLSEKFTNSRGIFNSWGNVVGMLTPDVPHWLGADLTSYIHQYLGIIPLLLVVIGIRFSPPRFRLLLLLLTTVHFLNGFSATGVHDQPFNMVQRFFNMIFPPLSLYQGRENFGYFVMLFLGVFLAMGFSVLVDRPEILGAHKRFILLLCLGLLGLKAVLAGIGAGSFIATSAFDLFAVVQIAVFAVCIVLPAKGQLRYRAVVLTLILLTAVDLISYSLRYKVDILQDGSSFYRALSATSAPSAPEEFQFFREPVVLRPMRHPLAFEESIFRTKGALSLGFNHSLFTTKRYYDFLTHVPLENQYYLNGMVLPILQFFPLDRVQEVSDKNALLGLYTLSSGSGITGGLFIEKPGRMPVKREIVRDFRQYPDAPWLLPEAMLNTSSLFMTANAPTVEAVRRSVRDTVRTPDALIKVQEFTANGISAYVMNRLDGYLYYNDG